MLLLPRRALSISFSIYLVLASGFAFIPEEKAESRREDKKTYTTYSAKGEIPAKAPHGSKDEDHVCKPCQDKAVRRR